MYVLMGNRVARTTDGGGVWTTMSTSACEGQCTYNQALSVHPTQPDTVLIGTIRPARSVDGGTTFTALTTTWGNSQKVHQDIHVVRYSSTDGNRFWVGGDGGMFDSLVRAISLGKSIEGLTDKSPVVQELLQKYLGVAGGRALPGQAASTD